MADNHTHEQRSKNMSAIKGKDTIPELVLRRFLFSKGLRFRKNDSRYPGKPDIVLPKYKTIIFVNGCFWHMHDKCNDFVWPKTNPDFWKAKILSNVKRDHHNYKELKENGWKVMVVWECQLKPPKRKETLEKVLDAITSPNAKNEDGLVV